MPDLQIAEQYIRSMTATERTMASAARRIWDAARDGVQRIARQVVQPGLAVSALEALLSDVASAVERDMRVSLEEVATHTATFVQAQAPTAAITGATPATSVVRAWQSAAFGIFLTDINRLYATGADTGAAIDRLVTGADGRQSVADAAGNSLQLAVEGAIWAAGNGYASRMYQQLAQRGDAQYRRQAIAAIDGRTTRCCLNVHGQIVDLDEPFHLTGSPKFGDYIMAPPFHHRCRTVVTLWHPSMEAIGTSTATMRTRARAELTRR